MSVILVVDDEPGLRQSFARLIEQEGHQALTAASGEEGIAALADKKPDLVVMDVRMPGISGLEALARMKAADPATPVIIMTAYGDTGTAIEAVNKGAFDYILKPFDIPEMLGLIQQALDASSQARGSKAKDAGEAPSVSLVGQSRAMREVYKQLGRVAATEATVLIQGESGTGKELAARAVWSYSPRKNRPFVVVNCVAIPESLLESELFGHEKGAFTGASQRRAGKIEQAQGGTVFLDEIGDMPLPVQAKLLRLLQEKQIERLGGKGPVPVDVRIIAATNRDLEAAMAEGRFREDLYYRLQVVRIVLPPLRERKEDLSQLAAHFLGLHARAMNARDPGITPGGLAALEDHAWPGNVRELSNVLNKTLIFSRGLAISADDVRAAIAGRTPAESHDLAADAEGALDAWVRAVVAAGGPDLHNRAVDRLSALVVAEALRVSGGNRTHAARLLGLSRPTLLAKMDKLGLVVEAQVRVGDVLS
ncbi:Nitrogen regulation protein NR(I) [Fundidesulfovibrio magnetotacticus]|uniref:DNA-binding transcriptional regulator NtrC n=1 Tax=Fundidesulfovibrio magnetotacticus TaxID=2730080 RepID=A0A6V8LVF1_9BACT|nr:sigma-54 dependent transcriptional regulator [Fundidesulfovibrio magnetotacticus]GFK93796.1 Nitrogen regulation protein NR(I) [Fundidesulfovibrio magnetotacticus]